MFQARTQRRLIKAPPVHTIVIRMPTSIIFVLFLLFAENELFVSLLKKLIAALSLLESLQYVSGSHLNALNTSSDCILEEDCVEAESGQ